MKKLLVIMLLLVLLLTGCTEQERAKSFGGEYTMELPQGQKLINVTWKEDTLWYLTRPMEETDIEETYTFEADSSWGIFEGTVTIQENK